MKSTLFMYTPILSMHLYTIMFKSNEMRTGQIVYKKENCFTIVNFSIYNVTIIKSSIRRNLMHVTVLPL